MSNEIENMAGKLDQFIEEYRGKVDAFAKKEDAVTRDEYKNMEDTLKADLKALRETIANLNAPKAEDVAAESLEKAKEAFGHYLTYGQNAGARDGEILKVKDVSLNVASEGGVFLPKIFSGELTDIIRKQSPIRSRARVIQSGQNYVHPIQTAKGTAGVRSEKGTIQAASSQAFDLLTWNPQAINGRQKATAWAHDGDAQVSLVAMLMQDLGGSLAEKEGDFFINSTNQNPLAGGGHVTTGILALTKDVSATDRFTNTVGSLSGVETAAQGAITFDDMMKLRSTLHGRYLPNAVYVMDAETELELLTLKDGFNRYLITNGDVVNGIPNRITGIDYVVEDNMSNSTGGARVILADLSKYFIVDHSQVRFVVNQVTDYTMVEYFAERRTAGAVSDAQAFRCLYDKAA